MLYEGQNRIMYKVKNKFYFISEKDNTCKCVCEVDSSFLECMDTDLKENVIFGNFIDSKYDIETQLKEHNSEHVFAIFDSIVAELDRQDLLENDFFKFCIHQIERENNIVYSESETDSSIDTNMQEAQETETEPTEAEIQTDFNAENTESSIKDNETQLDNEMLEKQIQAEQDKQLLKKFNEYKEFMELTDKIEPINHRIQELQNYLTRLENGEYYKKEIKERTDELNFRKKVVKRAKRENAQKQTEKSKEILEYWKEQLKIEKKSIKGWTSKEAVQEYIKNEIQSTQKYLMQYKHKKQNCIERMQELSCNKAVMNYMLENLKSKKPLRHTFATLPLYTERLKEQGYKEYELRNTTIYFSEKENSEYVIIDNCLNIECFDFNGIEIILEGNEKIDINLLENIKEYMRKNIIDIDKAEFEANIENKYINEMQSIIKEANITDKDTIEKFMCLKDNISKHVKKKSLLTFSMKNISLSHKQHKSLTDYKNIDSFNSVIEKRVIKATIAKERSPPLHRGA